MTLCFFCTPVVSLINFVTFYGGPKAGEATLKIVH